MKGYGLAPIEKAVRAGVVAADAVLFLYKAASEGTCDATEERREADTVGGEGSPVDERRDTGEREGKAKSKL
jgi:hypothetical protein